jgi:hypothetical protein
MKENHPKDAPYLNRPDAAKTYPQFPRPGLHCNPSRWGMQSCLTRLPSGASKHNNGQKPCQKNFSADYVRVRRRFSLIGVHSKPSGHIFREPDQ